MTPSTPTVPSDDASPQKSDLLSPKKVAIQLLGFFVGIALLIWCIHGAISGKEAQAGWDRLIHAPPVLILALLSCTAVSLIINATNFWLTIRPLYRPGYWNLQWLNLVGNMLNYAPIRLGALARIFYHMRVDGMSLLQVCGWFAFIGYIVLLSIGACLVSTFLHPEVDWLWGLFFITQMILGGILLKVFVGNQLLVKYGQGIDCLLANHWAVWGGMALRITDFAAFTGRMLVALKILDIDLPFQDAVILAVVAVAAGMVPFGRLGFREFFVASAAGWLSMKSPEVNANMQQLALVESAGEALMYIPLGAVALLWYRHRIIRHHRNSAQSERKPELKSTANQHDPARLHDRG